MTTQLNAGLISVASFILMLVIHNILVRRSGNPTRSLSSSFSGSNFFIIAISIVFLVVTAVAVYTNVVGDASTATLLYNGVSLIFISFLNLLKIDFTFTHVLGQALLVMLFIIIASFYYTVTFSKTELNRFVLYSVCIYLSGMLFLLTSSISVMFIAYELILLPTTLVLEYFSKTGRSREATQFMLV